MQIAMAKLGAFLASPRKCIDSTPTVTVAKFKYGAYGAFCFSMDLELAWGLRFSATRKHLIPGSGRFARDAVPGLLDLMEKKQISATWCIVGHLLLNRCRATQGRPHADMARPLCKLDDAEVDWYSADPCTSYVSDPSWYAPDLVRRIVNSKVPQDVGTHSFSHVDFSNCSVRVAADELSASLQLLRKFGCDPVTMIFPWNSVGHLEELVKQGIKVIRDGGVGALKYPSKKDALWIVTPTAHMSSRSSEFMLHYLLEMSVRTGTVCHLWTHEWELDEQTMTTLRGVFDHVNLLARKGYLWAANLKDLGFYCEARQRVKTLVRSQSPNRFDIEMTCNDPQTTPKTAVTLLIKSARQPILVRVDEIELPFPSQQCFWRDGALHVTCLTHSRKICVRFSPRES
jgi:hypothetical protein